MTHAIRVYKDMSKVYQLDLFEHLPNGLLGPRVIVRLDDSAEFHTIQEISGLVKFILLNTKCFFEIERL